MKIHRYYLSTAPWWLVCAHMKPIDRDVVVYRVGKVLGYIQ